jgi:hypothetical protein
MLRSSLLFVAMLGIAACSRSTPLSVENRSGVLLESVVVSGAGFTQALGNIGPGATAKAMIRPSGESALAMVFVASGKTVTLPPGGYFGGGGHYAVTVVVTPGLEAVVGSRLRP